MSESLLLAGGYQAQQLVGYVRCQEGRYLCGVVGRIYLDDVAAGEGEAHKPPHELLSLTTREAPDLRRPRAWRERRVYEIHIEGYVSLRVPYPLARTGYSLRYTYLPDLIRAYELEAQLPGGVPVIGVLQRAPHPAPTRKVFAVSKGAPTIAASLLSRSRTFGNRMKVRTPLKRGLSKELAGS